MLKICLLLLQNVFKNRPVARIIFCGGGGGGDGGGGAYIKNRDQIDTPWKLRRHKDKVSNLGTT